MVLALLSIVILSGCSELKEYTRSNFCKTKDYSNWEYENQLANDYDFYCIDKGGNNQQTLEEKLFVMDYQFKEWKNKG